ncbi:MAG: hypothetical protein BWY76_01705 [bacterium ADurb.Bin429]|nr:MAG: hypothetical protein BWY76_01705 [bacterium ADurb.Bin429]
MAAGGHGHTNLHVFEDHVGGLVVGREGITVGEGDGGFAPAIEGEAADFRVPGVVFEDDAILLAIPREDGGGGIFPDDGDAQALMMGAAFGADGLRDAIRAGGEVEDAVLLMVAQFIKRFLDGGGVIGDAVAYRAIVRLHVLPTGEGADELLGEGRGGEGRGG